MSDAESEIATIRRREANSGRVSYSEPVVLHDTSRSRIAFVAYFIPRSSGTELAVKLVFNKKRPFPQMWEEQFFTLKEAAARRLLASLNQHLAVSEENEDGDYLVIRVSEGVANLGTHDPAEIASALTNVLSQPEIVEHLRDTELSDELVHAFRGAIRLNELRSAVAQLRENLNSNITTESVYQDWCDRHTWAFGNAYVMRDEVRDISAGDTIDLLLPTVIAGYRDIVELKRPDMNVLNYDGSHRNYYFSSDVSKAIGQCHRYLDVLHEAAQNGLRDHPEIVAYHPRAIIVIGRSHDWEPEKLKALHGLNHRLSKITIMTYDQLLAQGERLIEMLGVERNAELSEDESINQEVYDEDEIPF